MIGVQPFRIDARALNEGFQPRIPGAPEHLQPLLDEDAVLPGQVHHIPHRGDGDIFHQIIHVFRVLLHHIVERFHQLVGYRRAAQPFERIGAVRLMRVNHRVRPWQYIFSLPVHLSIWHLMVVRDDDGQSVVLSVGNLFRRRDAVVTCNDGVNAVPDRAVDEVDIESVAVPDAVRDIGIHIRPQPGESLLQDISGVHSVDVIIPDDADRLFLPYLLRQNLHCPVHVLHQHPVREVRNGPVQVQLHRIVPQDVPVADEPRQDGRDVVFFCNPVEIRFLHRNKPSFHM